MTVPILQSCHSAPVLIELALGHELPKSPTNCELAKRVDGGHIAIL